MGFIETIAPIIQKYAPQYGIKVVSPIIAQAVLESASGTSELAVNARNYFGLKYKEGRCPTCIGSYTKVGSEQNPDGSYVSSVMTWMSFPHMDAGVQGYFDFLFNAGGRYDNLKGITDAYKYLETIKADGYATSIKYVDNVYAVIKKYDLTKYDEFETKDVEPKAVVIKDNIANSMNYGGKRSTDNIRWIVIHYTANDGDMAKSNGNYFHNNIVKASAHYFVDQKEIIRSVPDDYNAYSVGGKKYANNGGKYYQQCTNSNSISIELCDGDKNGVIAPLPDTIDNALWLVRDLMKKYNVPAERVIRHYDVNGKPCPLYWVDDDKWEKEFHSKIGDAPATKEFEPYVVKVVIDFLNVRKGASTKYDVVNTIHQNEKYTIVEEQNGWGLLKAYQKNRDGWINISNKYVVRV